MLDKIVQLDIEPTIKRGWLRAILFLIVSTIVSGIVGFISLLSVIFIFNDEFDLSLINKDISELMEFLGPFNMGIITLFQFLGMFAILCFFRKFIDKKSIKSLGFEFIPFTRDLLLGLLFGTGFILIGFIILHFFGYVKVIDIQFPVLNQLNYFILFIFVSLNEEIMIRGYILNNLMASMNKYIALIVSSVLFSIMHIANANISLIGVLNLFIAGILLGIYYIHKTNLWFPIGMHLTWNYFQGPVFGYEVSGFNTQSIITQEIQGNPIITGGEFGFEGSIIATILNIIMIILIHKMTKPAYIK